jgi:hypothetical protein
MPDDQITINLDFEPQQDPEPDLRNSGRRIGLAVSPSVATTRRFIAEEPRGDEFDVVMYLDPQHIHPQQRTHTTPLLIVSSLIPRA